MGRWGTGRQWWWQVRRGDGGGNSGGCAAWQQRELLVSCEGSEPHRGSMAVCNHRLARGSSWHVGHRWTGHG
jgi:hypothetical protein